MIKEHTSLRFIFILFIFLGHILFPGHGGAGAAFFFVLSGFGLSLGYKYKVLRQDFSYKSFIKKRFIKLYPLHWILLLCSIPLVYRKLASIKTIPILLLNIGLLQTWVPIDSYYYSFNSVSWFLADTVFLTLFFPFLSRVISNVSKKQKTILAVGILVLYFAIYNIVPDNMHHALFYIHPIARTVDFIIGIYLANVFFDWKENQNVISFANKNSVLLKFLAFLGIAFLFWSSYLKAKPLPTAYYWPVIIIVILTTALLSMNNTGGILRSKWLVSLGEISFEFFLLHQLVIRYCTLFFRFILHYDNLYVLTIICLIISIVGSYLISIYINKPIIKWLTNKILPSTTVRS